MKSERISPFWVNGYQPFSATAFKTNPDVRLLNCLVHIRRHFEQALDENREMAQHALTQIQHIYKIERQCDEAGLSYDERRLKRQELARPIMEAMKVWMETEGIKYSPGSQIGKAITYAYTRWDNMMGCLEDGRLLWDNNLAENVIRPITLGRLCSVQHNRPYVGIIFMLTS